MTVRPPEPAPAGDPDRFAPRAAGAMAEMFDEVVPRYDFLNRLMTLGRDEAWRRTAWHAVPENARVVLDLCSGSGTSLTGLRRPGRLVIGLDVSFKMLVHAAEEGRAGWAPRLVCADGFHLPFANRSVDCVTAMFGVRNLRPRPDALAEIRRVLRHGGSLVVLEATAPGPGSLAPFHRFYLRTLVPLMGRLSPDPSAYRYLAASIEEFGDGSDFERDLERAGFVPGARRRFMFGAAGLWWARIPPEADADASRDVQPARKTGPSWGELPTPGDPREGEWRLWTGLQVALSALLLITLIWALRLFADPDIARALEPWQMRGMNALLWLGIAAFVVRTLVLLLRLFGGRPPR